jgi:hypothetical protein
MQDLTNSEKLLFEWLSKEDFSSLGECEGQALTVLVNLGLAEIGPTPIGRHPHYRPVSLTDAGRAALMVNNGISGAGK